MATNRITVASLSARMDAHDTALASIADTLVAMQATLVALASPAPVAPKARKAVTPKAAKVAAPKAKAPRAPKADARPVPAFIHERAANRVGNRELADALRAMGLPTSGAVWAAAKTGVTSVDALRKLV